MEEKEFVNTEYTNNNEEKNIEFDGLEYLEQEESNVEAEFTLDTEIENDNEEQHNVEMQEQEYAYQHQVSMEESYEEAVEEQHAHAHAHDFEESYEEESYEESYEEESYEEESYEESYEEESSDFTHNDTRETAIASAEEGVEMFFDDFKQEETIYESSTNREDYSNNIFIKLVDRESQEEIIVTKNDNGEYVDGIGTVYSEEYVLETAINKEDLFKDNNDGTLDSNMDTAEIPNEDVEEDLDLFSSEENIIYEIYDEETDTSILIQKDVLGNYVDEEGNIYTEEFVLGTEEDVTEEDMYDTDLDIEDLKTRQSEYRDKIQETMSARIDIGTTDFHLKSNEGGTIPTRQNGNISVEYIPIEGIKVTKRTRMEGKPSYDLQESITRFGQLTPIHVVKYGEYYLLLDGKRRLEALKHNGKDHVVALIDDTIAPQLVKYYEAIVNNKLAYSFEEVIQYCKFVQTNQPELDVSVIESILGLGNGEMYKALYVDSMRDTYAEIYGQLANGKLSIDQAFKKIEKEIAKAEKEGTSDNMDELNSGAMDDQLRSVDELSQMQNEPDQQDVHNRKILDPVLRRSVESRDKGYCQCCEYGKGEPDLMGVFNVHHMIAVMYGGSDSQSNLILLCSNCHTLVHDYERGRFHPEKETYDKHIYIQKIIVLGNMLATMKKKALATLRTKFENTARLVDANKMGLGKAIHKHNIVLDGEKYFNGSPYATFVESTKNLNLGGAISGELGELNYLEEDSNEMVSEEETEE